MAAKPVVVSPVIEAPIHYHTDDCYEEVLTCGLEEHHHTVNCLADPLADVEDESEWLAKTSTSLSGDWSADLLTVAQSQLGYTQSEKNFEVDADDGVTVRHYTRYGEWYGNPYGEWDVMFLSYCLELRGHPAVCHPAARRCAGPAQRPARCRLPDGPPEYPRRAAGRHCPVR